MTGIQGGCFCTNVNFECDGKPHVIINCHCSQCRQLSGAAFTTWVSLPRKSFVLAGESMLSPFVVTSNVTRHFCRNCGTHVYTADQRYPQIVGIPAGVIANGLITGPTAHYFISHKAVWHLVNDDSPQFGGEGGFAPLQ